MKRRTASQRGTAGWRARLVGLMALTCVAAAGCSSSDSDDQPSGDGPAGSVRYALEGYPSSFAPGVDNGFGWVRVPYENLVMRAPDDPGEILPQLATEWTVEDNAITFTLRDGVTFHDGSAFDSEAAKANLDYVKDEAGPFSAGLNVIESIDTPDPTTLVLNLSGPAPGLLSTLTGRGGVMAGPESLQNGTLAEHPVGTGPWAYDESISIPGTELGFTLYEDYWDIENVHTRRLVLVGIDDSEARLNAMLTREVDVADVDVILEEQATSAGAELAIYPALYYGLMMFDRGPGGVLEDLEVREAVCAAIDTEGLAAIAGGSFLTPANQRFPEGTYGHNPDIPDPVFDPDTAKDLLAGREVELSMLAWEQNQIFAEAIAGALSEVGVDTKVQTVTPAEYFTGWYDGTHPIGNGDNTEPTPSEWYGTWFAADAPNNPSGVESPQLAAAAAAALAEADPEAAEPLWAEVMRVIDEEKLTCNNLVINQAAGWFSDNVSGVETITWEASALNFKELRPEG